MPEPSFWQYLSGQVPEEEIRTWPAECSLPGLPGSPWSSGTSGWGNSAVHLLLAVLMPDLPCFHCSPLVHLVAGIGQREKSGIPLRAAGNGASLHGSRSSWQFLLGSFRYVLCIRYCQCCWESLHTNDWLVIYIFWISVMFIFFGWWPPGTTIFQVGWNMLKPSARSGMQGMSPTSTSTLPCSWLGARQTWASPLCCFTCYAPCLRRNWFRPSLCGLDEELFWIHHSIPGRLWTKWQDRKTSSASGLFAGFDLCSLC